MEKMSEEEPEVPEPELQEVPHEPEIKKMPPGTVFEDIDKLLDDQGRKDKERRENPGFGL